LKWQQLKLKEPVISGKLQHNLKLTWNNTFVSVIMKNCGFNRKHWITWIIFNYRLPPLCIRKHPFKLKKRWRIRCQELSALCCGLWRQKLAPVRRHIFCFCLFTQRYKVHNSPFFSRFLQFCEKRQLGPSCLSVCLSALIEQLCSHRTNFLLLWDLILEDFQKSVEKILLISGKNSG
jgi:hypothetical protein